MFIFKKTGLFAVAITLVTAAQAQREKTLDSLADYDALFGELESFIDSLTAPRSFATANISVSKSLFQYETASTTSLQETKRLLFAPSIGYYNKNGFGISAVASFIKEPEAVTYYQTAATASYDYLKKRAFLTGFSFTHFFTKKKLPFYTSPLSNEVYTFFSYRAWWLRPALAAGYGWGSITSVEERKEKIKLLKGKKLNATTTTETTEQISDLSLSASVKHDFYWRNVVSKHDVFRVTPQVVLSGGTQKFGLAQTNNYYVSEKRTGNAVLYNSENSFIAATSHFQILSFSGRMRTEFSKGIFFVQPQVLFDYFVPEKDATVTTSFLLNAGILF